MTTPPGATPPAGSQAPFLDALKQAGDSVGVLPPDATLPAEKAFAARRRAAADEDPIGTLLLTESDGVLRWTDWYVSPVSGARRRRREQGPVLDGRIVEQFKFERLGPSQVGQFLETLDGDLTPAQGLKKWTAGQPLQPVPGPSPAAKRCLLFIHGTFSKSQVLFDELEQTAEGRRFLEKAAKHYGGEILAFDHPTLSVSPLLNALDLTRLFAGSAAPVDVVCHSRGGLVARWWLEVLRPPGAPAGRAILVGSPLAGTSLASPVRLRAALNLVTNIARAMSVAGAAASSTLPILTVVTGVMKAVASLSSLAARTPLVDAGLALVPGLAGQSAVSNNAEIVRLRRTAAPPPGYFAILSNFETEDPGWAFWKRFRKLALLDEGADVIFEGANDLVVDTGSMTQLGPTANITAVLDYQKSSKVHHTNYFSQGRTADFILKSLQIP